MNVKEIGSMLWKNSLQANYEIIKRKLGFSKPIMSFGQQHPCVFVLSTGRVGTETVSALLGLSREYVVFHEPEPKLYKLGKQCYELQNPEVQQVLIQEAFLLARSQLLERALQLGCGYIETSPQVTFLARIIRDLMPYSKFIHLFRDPREVVRSGMRRNWFNNSENDVSRIAPIGHSSCQINWDSATELEKNIWLWAETNNWIMDFEKEVSTDRFVRINSNDLFNANENTIKSLFSFVNREPPPFSQIDKIMSQKLNRQKRGDFPSPQEWSAEMNNSLQSLAGSTIKSLGLKLV